LTKAASIEDPLERFKLVIAYMISGIHLMANCAKPFNPLLGETYQAEFPNGTNVFCEHVSHHPPIT
jgi:hypothetical protein